MTISTAKRISVDPAQRPSSYQERIPVRSSGINFCGYLRTESGVGAAARGYVRAIKAAGLPLALLDISHLQTNRSLDQSLNGFQTDFSYDVNVVCADVELHYAILSHYGEQFFQDRYNIGLWAWELPRFPKKWFDRFAYYDEIWVASAFIFDALSAVSPVPVVRMPPVLTPESYGSRERGRERLRITPEDFVFLFVFDFHSHAERKNPLATIEAFRKVFSAADRARLVIKCVNAQSKPRDFALLQQQAQGARIEIHDGYWPAADIRDLMAACDAYVSLHRSEGTGLTIADAMALGKPVIATGWSGNMDFMSVANSYPVGYELVTVRENVGPYQSGETWAEPSVEHAAECMRAVFERRAEAAERGRAAERDIQRGYSEEAVAARITQRMESIKIRRRFEDFRRETQDHRAQYGGLREHIQSALLEDVPREARVLVVSKGDEKLVDLPQHQGWHFPQDAEGVYAGYYPANSHDAICHLEELRERGAGFLVLPSSAFWWLQKYEQFGQHLDRHYRRVHESENCIIFGLAAPSPDLDELEQDIRNLAAHQKEIRSALAFVVAEEEPIQTAAGSNGSARTSGDEEKAAGPGDSYDELIGRIRETVQAVVPRQAHLVVVSKGDPKLLNHPPRSAAHFPQTGGGKYAGHHPADSAAAIDQVEALKVGSDCYLLIPATAFWWLGHYVEFRRHLDAQYQRLWSDAACIIYDLSSDSLNGGAAASTASRRQAGSGRSTKLRRRKARRRSSQLPTTRSRSVR